MSDEAVVQPRSEPPRRHKARRRATSRSWIGLNEASHQLGVSATTLRRWADAGIVRTFVTPGGHRRFDAESVGALLPGRAGRPTMEQLGETPERISRAYRRSAQHPHVPWVTGLDDAQRLAFREHGQGIARELLAALDASTDGDRAAHVSTASQAASHYGVVAAERGLGVATTVQTFLQFRRPFIAELYNLSRRRGLDTPATTELMAIAGDAIDELLVATVRAYEERSATK